MNNHVVEKSQSKPVSVVNGHCPSVSYSCIIESKCTCLRCYTNMKQLAALTPETKNLQNNYFPASFVFT